MSKLHNVAHYGPQAEAKVEQARELLEEALDAAVRAANPPLSARIALALAALDIEAAEPSPHLIPFSPPFLN